MGAREGGKEGRREGGSQGRREPGEEAGGEEKVRRKEEVSDPNVGCKLRAHEVAEGSSSGRMRVREVRHLGAAGGAAEEEVRRKEEERIAEGLDESTQVLDLTKLYLSSI